MYLQSQESIVYSSFSVLIHMESQECFVFIFIQPIEYVLGAKQNVTFNEWGLISLKYNLHMLKCIQFCMYSAVKF